MVFETIRFGRSRIPPGRDVRGSGLRSSSGEERPEQLRALVRPHSRPDLRRVVQTGVGREVVEASARARLRVGCTEHEERHDARPRPRRRTSGTARGSRRARGRRVASVPTPCAASRKASSSACAVGSDDRSRSLWRARRRSDRLRDRRRPPRPVRRRGRARPAPPRAPRSSTSRGETDRRPRRDPMVTAPSARPAACASRSGSASSSSTTRLVAASRRMVVPSAPARCR